MSYHGNGYYRRSPPPPPPPPPGVGMAGLGGIAQLTPALFLSGGAAATSRHAVYARGITCIVNATLEISSPRWPDVEYLKVPLPDLPHAPLSLYFDTVADKVQQVSRKNGRVLVHCVAGVSRSATLCIAYLMKHHKQSLREAHSWVRSRRPVVRPNHGFWRQLIDYEKRLFGKNTVRMVPSPVGMVPDLYEKETRGLMPYWTFR
ncbi:dual specificity protein phosphatase 14-like [Carcharodon carcharias]|uniref:dual specificity protein phosphatase 14-like n=1 Tax=Carcharodon carcharias TaxID=13397 RepID=UPI001B7EB08E|nr:dual specificity protein phosphatase 14-like [Carcharodon carcharias]